MIVKCSNSGTIGFAGTASRGSTYGGIAAMAKNIIANCYNTGTISVAALEGKAINAGGIVGIMQKNYTVRTSDILFNCYSSGNIVRSASATSSGPIYGAYRSLTPRNNYFLKTDAINSGYSDGVGSAAMDAAQLKAAAGTLGAAFCADTASVNGGYPLLNWEATGKMDPSELEGISIVSAEASNSAITLTLDRRLLYSTLTASDFTVEATLQLTGEAEQTLALKSAAPSPSTRTTRPPSSGWALPRSAGPMPSRRSGPRSLTRAARRSKFRRSSPSAISGRITGQRASAGQATAQRPIPTRSRRLSSWPCWQKTSTTAIPTRGNTSSRRPISTSANPQSMAMPSSGSPSAAARPSGATLTARITRSPI